MRRVRNVAATLFLGLALIAALRNVTPTPLVAQRPKCTADEGRICRMIVDCPPPPGKCTETSFYFELEEKKQ